MKKIEILIHSGEAEDLSKEVITKLFFEELVDEFITTLIHFTTSVDGDIYDRLTEAEFALDVHYASFKLYLFAHAYDDGIHPLEITNFLPKIVDLMYSTETEESFICDFETSVEFNLS
jgi:hypothetical protein